MPLSYADASLARDSAANADPVRALQRDLRQLGYLKRRIDGHFGDGTQEAVCRLQFDLLRNDGRSTADDGSAPVAVASFNRGVTAVTGVVDSATASSIEAMLASAAYPKLPNIADPKTVNVAAMRTVAALTATAAPVPFMLAIFQQESGGEHFAVPQGGDDADNFVTVGLDTNDAASQHHVTSRGYGLGQYTIFHHPPRPEEVADFILDPAQNVRKAFKELRDKFDGFVLGQTANTQADDRLAEHPLIALRLCRYQPSDQRYMNNCRNCAAEARKLTITPTTPVYSGAIAAYGQASAYGHRTYTGVPDRADFQCDWPYAVRRYNGSGPNSYAYQAIVLGNLLATPSAVGPSA
jgi:peptidoglycan hydrolase-like protein with peptidoglycan-binding domain